MQEFVREEFESQQMQARKVKKIKPLCKEFRREGKCGDACSMEADNAHGEKCKVSLTDPLVCCMFCCFSHLNDLNFACCNIHCIC